MATRTFPSSDGSERLVISTICTHLPFFHEAGFAYRTERRERVAFVPWRPATWRGKRWSARADAAQPTDVGCVFVQQGGIERDAAAFDVTAQIGDGTFKSSCEDMMTRAHCVFVVNVDQPASVARPRTADACSVVDVCIRFTYDGQAHELWHTTRRSAVQRASYVDNASTRAR